MSKNLLDIRNVALRDDMLIIRYGDFLKQSRPGYHLDEISFAEYPDDKDSCVLHV